MNISLLNEQILIQKSSVIVDQIGNHYNEWMDYYNPHATVSGEGKISDAEALIAGATSEIGKVDFTMRYCKKLSNINSGEYRVIFREHVYNIINIDHQNYKRKSIKLMCRKEGKLGVGQNKP